MFHVPRNQSVMRDGPLWNIAVASTGKIATAEDHAARLEAPVYGTQLVYLPTLGIRSARVHEETVAAEEGPRRRSKCAEARELFCDISNNAIERHSELTFGWGHSDRQPQLVSLELRVEAVVDTRQWDARTRLNCACVVYRQHSQLSSCPVLVAEHQTRVAQCAQEPPTRPHSQCHVEAAALSPLELCGCARERPNGVRRSQSRRADAQSVGVRDVRHTLDTLFAARHPKHVARDELAAAHIKCAHHSAVCEKKLPRRAACGHRKWFVWPVDFVLQQELAHIA